MPRPQASKADHASASPRSRGFYAAKGSRGVRRWKGIQLRQPFQVQQPVRLVARVAGFYICTHSHARECPHIGKPATYATDISQRVPGPKGRCLRPTGEESNAAEASMARRGIEKLEMVH